jgi:site-specific recombinase XerD
MQQENHLKAFRNHLLGLGKSRATIRTYESDVKVLLRFIGKEDISAISYDDIERYVQEMKSRVQKSSWRHNIFAIKIWLKFIKAYNNNNTADHFDNLPKEMNLLRPPKTREEKATRKIEPLTKAEENKLYEASKSKPRDNALFRVFFVSLQRVSSIMNINVQDIDFENKEILIHAKGDEEYTITIDDGTLQAIQDYLKVREPPKEGYVLDTWGRKRYHKGSLFLNGFGKRPTNNLANQLFKKYAVKCHIEKRIFPHLTRHSGITYLLDHGVPMKTVAEQSGHKTMEVLMRYHHPDKKESRQTVVNMLTKEEEHPIPSQPEPPKKQEHPTDVNYAQKPDIQDLMKQIQALQSKVKILEKSSQYDMSFQ